MHRPRWHDAAIAMCIAALFAAGLVALWGDEARTFLQDEPAEPHPAIDPRGL